MKGTIGCLSGIAWLALGAFQIVAVASGIQFWLGWNILACWIIAFFVGGWPIVGTTLGMVGAHYAWEWSWLSAFMLFWGFAISILTLTLAVGGFAAIYNHFKRDR